jgi:hypothetical protein
MASELRQGQEDRLWPLMPGNSYQSSIIPETGRAGRNQKRVVCVALRSLPSPQVTHHLFQNPDAILELSKMKRETKYLSKKDCIL